MITGLNGKALKEAVEWIFKAVIFITATLLIPWAREVDKKLDGIQTGVTTLQGEITVIKHEDASMGRRINELEGLHPRED